MTLGTLRYKPRQRGLRRSVPAMEDPECRSPPSRQSGQRASARDAAMPRKEGDSRKERGGRRRRRITSSDRQSRRSRSAASGHARPAEGAAEQQPVSRRDRGGKPRTASSALSVPRHKSPSPPPPRSAPTTSEPREQPSVPRPPPAGGAVSPDRAHPSATGANQAPLGGATAPCLQAGVPPTPVPRGTTTVSPPGKAAPPPAGGKVLGQGKGSPPL